MRLLFTLSLGIILSIGLSSCQPHEHGPDTHVHGDDEDHDDHPEVPTDSYTLWSDDIEVFIDHSVLIANETSQLITHLTDRHTYKPLSGDVIKLFLKKENKPLRELNVKNSKDAGIVLSDVTVVEEGTIDLIIYISNQSIVDTFTIKDMVVYASEEDAIANHPNEENDDEISFLKPQAWKMDFAVSDVERKEIQNVIHTSGEVLPMESDEESITASTDGLVIFKNTGLVEGQQIKQGVPLFTVNSEQIISDNLTEKYAVLKANLDQSKNELKRSKELFDKGIISAKAYESRQRQVTVDQAAYETLSKNYSNGGSTLHAPTSGILKKLNVVNGQFINEGQSLAIISRNKQLIVEAEVSQKHFQDIGKITSANIKLPWDEKVHPINAYNGKMISTNLSAKNHYIPVVFKIDNKGDIMPGTFLELYLLTSPVKNALTIPREALLKEYNSYYVYVMNGGESFEKRTITIGIDNGQDVQVLSGLNENDKIVSRGAYAVKTASMSSSFEGHHHH